MCTIKTAVLLSCIFAACLAVDEHRQKIEEARGKRNLEYTISHHYPSTSYRLERRLSPNPQPPRYNPYFPGPRSYSPYRKGRPHSFPAPPYAVQMEPLVHYSQRDPLYDTNTLSLIADGNNELTKPEDLLTENNHITENVYGPPRHYIERPVYVKEPEPIIEIIIKESNVTLPPLPLPVVTPAPKKKEQVQVFYVKYKKNPNGHGKDSVIYEKPIPAITPVPPIEHEEESHQAHYEQPQYVTSAPPPSTTLRTIIKPDSEVYHGPSGIKVTFGKEGFDYEKRSSKNDDENEESAPQPSISHPQARQFPLQSFFQRRLPILNFQSAFNFRPETPRQPQPYKPFTPPPTQYKSQAQFGRQHPQTVQFPSQLRAPQRQQTPNKGSSSHFHNQQFIQKPQFSQQVSSVPQQTFNFNIPRQPVPYQPFEQVRPQQQQQQQQQPQQPLPPQFQFPRTQTHFPIHQQPPLVQQQNIFNQQQLSPQPTVPTFQHTNLPQQQQIHPNHQPQQEQQNFPQHQQQIHQNYQPQHEQQHFHQKQQQLHQNHQPQHEQQHFAQQQQQIHQNHQQQHEKQHFPQQQQQQQLLPQIVQQQTFNQQSHLNNLQQAQHLLPPGGELIHSLPKYEQHISISSDSSQQISDLTLQQQQQQSKQQEAQAQQIQQYRQSIETSTERRPVQQQQQYFIQNGVPIQQNAINFNSHPPIQQKLQQTTPRPTTYGSSTTPTITYQSSTYRTEPTTEKTTAKPVESKPDEKDLSIQLPDEVPDELRQQLLSSGILKNADISILDYDKIGDIPLSALPPDQLANFYSAGGAQQIASGSAPIPSVVEPDGTPVGLSLPVEQESEDLEMEGSETEEVKVKPPVEMKVVHYDPQTEQGQKVQDSYVQNGAMQIDPVVLNDQKYTRYLPLKVSGAQFPIPDVPELKNKLINSVVVLAPVDYNFQDGQRKTRDVQSNLEQIEYVIGEDTLKELVENPTMENYKKFLEKENKTAGDRQSVILLVVGSNNETEKEKEIYMYDISTKTVNKLNGELSTAFVEAAESNSGENKNPPPTSNTLETTVSSSNVEEIKVEPSKTTQKDVETIKFSDLEKEIAGKFKGFEGSPSNSASDGLLTAASSDLNSLENRVYINTGYSKTGYSLPS